MDSGNDGVWVKTNRWRWIGAVRIRVMAKLDESKVRWIVRECKKGTRRAEIAEQMEITESWVKQLYSRYRHCKDVEYPAKMGRPANGLPGRREHSAVLYAHGLTGHGAVRLEAVILDDIGIHIPHNTIHSIMRENDLAARQPRKSKQRKYVRYEREHSNSLWHTDYTQLKDKRWLIVYEDDASRFITGYGIFEHATTENAISVLHEAIARHGKPAAVMTDHGSQFYANESAVKKKGVSMYEQELVRLGIRHILSGVGHPQTNGKVERLFGEIKRKAAILAGPGTGDGYGYFIRMYNEKRPHDSLHGSTPADAFKYKMAPNRSETEK